MITINTILLLLILAIVAYLAYKLGHGTGTKKANDKWKEQLPLERKDAINRSRAILGGNFSEQLAPYLPNYPYNPTESKFLGKPIDLIIFKGADNKNIEEIIFLEIKSGNSKLTNQEQQLKKTIKEKKVRWEEYRIPKKLTEKKKINEEELL